MKIINILSVILLTISSVSCGSSKKTTSTYKRITNDSIIKNINVSEKTDSITLDVKKFILDTSKQTNIIIEDDSSSTFTFPILVPIDSGSITDLPKVRQNGKEFAVFQGSQKKEKRHKKEENTITTNKIDSSTFKFTHVEKGKDSTDGTKVVHQEITVSDKTVKKTSINFWWLFLIVPIYLIWRYRKYILKLFI